MLNTLGLRSCKIRDLWMRGCRVFYLSISRSRKNADTPPRKLSYGRWRYTYVDAANELTGPWLPESRLHRADSKTYTAELTLQNSVDRNFQTAALGSQQPPGDHSQVFALILSQPKDSSVLHGIGEKSTSHSTTGIGSMTADNQNTYSNWNFYARIFRHPCHRINHQLEYIWQI